jgi:hypothetical protein
MEGRPASRGVLSLGDAQIGLKVKLAELGLG